MPLAAASSWLVLALVLVLIGGAIFAVSRVTGFLMRRLTGRLDRAASSTPQAPSGGPGIGLNWAALFSLRVWFRFE